MMLAWRIDVSLDASFRNKWFVQRGSLHNTSSRFISKVNVIALEWTPWSKNWHARVSISSMVSEWVISDWSSFPGFAFWSMFSQIPLLPNSIGSKRRPFSSMIKYVESRLSSFDHTVFLLWRSIAWSVHSIFMSIIRRWSKQRRISVERMSFSWLRMTTWPLHRPIQLFYQVDPSHLMDE